MWLRTSCDLSFDITGPIPFVLMLRPRSGAQQWIAREEYRLEPSVPVFEFTDNYGNLCQRLIAPTGVFKVRTSAEVMTSDDVDQAFGAPFVEIQNLPNDVLSYLLPSRYCESDRFHDMASEITAGEQPGYDQVAAIVTWLRNTISYCPGSSDSPRISGGSQFQTGRCLPGPGTSRNRAVPQPQYSRTHGGGLPLPIGANGPARLVRGLRGWSLVYVRRNAGQAKGRICGCRLWPRCRGCRHLQSVRARCLSDNKDRGCGTHPRLLAHAAIGSAVMA